MRDVSGGLEEVFDGVEVGGADAGRRQWVDLKSGGEDDEPAALQESLLCCPLDCAVGVDRSVGGNDDAPGRDGVHGSSLGPRSEPGTAGIPGRWGTLVLVCTQRGTGGEETICPTGWDLGPSPVDVGGRSIGG